jgi:hypothetical protein
MNDLQNSGKTDLTCRTERVDGNDYCLFQKWMAENQKTMSVTRKSAGPVRRYQAVCLICDRGRLLPVTAGGLGPAAQRGRWLHAGRKRCFPRQRATTLRFPFPARGRGRKGMGRFPRRGIGGFHTRAAKRLPFQNGLPHSPPRILMGVNASKNKTRPGAKRPAIRTRISKRHDRQGCRACRLPVSDSCTSGREGARSAVRVLADHSDSGAREHATAKPGCPKDRHEGG